VLWQNLWGSGVAPGDGVVGEVVFIVVWQYGTAELVIYIWGLGDSNEELLLG
jgi:hypothetical protein